MDNRDHLDRPEANDDHWAMFADAMDLTIEGHRLIAQEIGYEAKLLWRAVISWMHETIGGLSRGRSSPPV